MSARKSNQAKTIKRYGAMAERYQERIDNQQEIITRLTKAVTIAEQALYSIENEAWDLEEVRAAAMQGHTKMIKALEKKENTEE